MLVKWAWKFNANRITTHLVLILKSNSPSGLTLAELLDLKLRVLNDSLNFCDSLPRFSDPPRENFDGFKSIAVSALLLLLLVLLLLLLLLLVLLTVNWFPSWNIRLRPRVKIWWHSESESAPISSTLLPFCKKRRVRDGLFFGIVLCPPPPPPLDSWLASLQYDDVSSPDALFKSFVKLGLCVKKGNGLVRLDWLWCVVVWIKFGAKFE